MADLHEALKSLSPVEWDDLPHSALAEYIQQLAVDTDLICNSVPAQPEDARSDDIPPTSSGPNTAQTALETKATGARLPASRPDLEALQSHWGKPMKFSAKDNPLKVSVFKMAGRDRHGAWFARRSLHEGIGFRKFRTAMLRELPQTMTVKGGPGAGSIRGIGADQRLERVLLNEAGSLEVLQLSAQFPGPTTPREFITLLVTTEQSGSHPAGHYGRQLMIISRPVSHAQAPERQGYIRGQYESVEMIREILPQRLVSESTPNLPSVAATDKPNDLALKLKRSATDIDGLSGADDAELNPVEWIMVTRSDPGGGIPRFMVDRGTPSTMLGDVTKFLDWATNIDENEEPDLDTKQVDGEVSQPAHVSTQPKDLKPHQNDSSGKDPAVQEQGVFQQLTTAVEASLEAYAPAMVSSFIHERLHRRSSFDSSSDSSIISSTGSFASAADFNATSGANLEGNRLRSDTNSTTSDIKALQATMSTRDKNHEKELTKIQDAKEKLAQRHARKLEEEKERLQKSQDAEDHESSKALERYNKEVKKREERHQKESDKLEAKRERELKKYEDKRRKENDRDAMQKVTRERDDFRTQVDLLKRENALLRERIEALENMTIPSS